MPTHTNHISGNNSTLICFRSFSPFLSLSLSHSVVVLVVYDYIFVRALHVSLISIPRISSFEEFRRRSHQHKILTWERSIVFNVHGWLKDKEPFHLLIVFVVVLFHHVNKPLEQSERREDPPSTTE